MDFNEAMNYINSFTHSGKKVTDLSRIAALLECFGNPQKKLKFVHIAGTNGKGSVLEYCSRAFINAGIKTGQFTSPYILTYCDRIRINGENIPAARVAQICTKVKNAVNSGDFSQFEITFAIALLYFLEEKCDIVFLETGIGGTLDATNIIEEPMAAVITSISLDHTAILGNTVEEIATHKLGIIKKNSSVILSCNNIKSVKILAETTAYKQESNIVIPSETFLKVLKSDIFGTEFIYKNKEYSLKMCGKHQVINALTAIETLEILKKNFNISDSDIKKALSESFVGSRIEIISNAPLIIIDGGHNEAGVNSLAAILSDSKIKKLTVIFGMVEGKAVDYSVKKISEFAERVYCVDGFINNSISSEILVEKFNLSGVITESCTCNNVWEKAIAYSKISNTPLLVCGSLYLASQMRQNFKESYL